ncbi:MAG: TonB family protein, partial [Lentisphaeria bacterium]|nr:TonB family protein [Lentisphaeria bacterium]
VEPKKDPPKTEPKKDPPKTEPKKDPPKTEPKKDPPKTEPKKDPPKSNLLTADQINVKKNTKTQAQLDAERKAREAAEARAKADAKARQDLIADIRAAAGSKPGTYGTTTPGREGILATKEMREYYEQLNAFIRPKWNAVSPSSVELSGKISNWPSVDLTIAKDGRVTSAVIVSPSGNKAIDAAVKTLLADLKVVPAPPQAGVIRVTLDIR